MAMTLVGAPPIGMLKHLSYAYALSASTTQTTFKVLMHHTININGEPTFIFMEMKLNTAANKLNFAMVLKFLKNRQSIEVIHLSIVKNWGFSKIPTISIMGKLGKLHVPI